MSERVAIYKPVTTSRIIHTEKRCQRTENHSRKGSWKMSKLTRLAEITVWVARKIIKAGEVCEEQVGSGERWVEW